MGIITRFKNRVSFAKRVFNANLAWSAAQQVCENMPGSPGDLIFVKGSPATVQYVGADCYACRGEFIFRQEGSEESRYTFDIVLKKTSFRGFTVQACTYSNGYETFTPEFVD